MKKAAKKTARRAAHSKPFSLIWVKKGGILPWGNIPDKEVVERYRTLEAAKKRVQELNAWADVLDLPDSCLDHIVVKKNGRKVYEQGHPID